MTLFRKIKTARHIGLCRALQIQAHRLGWEQKLPLDKSGALTRDELGVRYIAGSGIEIGAAAHPLRVSRRARVCYVDRYSNRQFVDYVNSALFDGYDRRRVLRQAVKIGRVDNGETLETFESDSQDFVIANHVLEHTQNPLGTLGNWLRVLRPGGVLFLTVPDKRRTFDLPRPITPLCHLIADAQDGGVASRRQHFEEFTRLVIQPPAHELAAKIESSIAQDESIHFHVWTQAEVMELLLYLRQSHDFDFEVTLSVGNEFVALLRKS